MSMEIRGAIAAGAILVLGALAPAPAEAGKADNSLIFASDLVPESIDAYFNNVREGVIIAHHVWSHLIHRDPKTGQYQPELATSWGWTDPKTLDFELRTGVKFDNGDGFGPDDVVYTLNFVSKPEAGVITQQNVNWIESAERLSDTKVRIHLKAPFPAALEYLAGPVVIYPGAYYKQVGPKGMSDHPVGSGPYKVVAYEPGKRVVMERFKDYFKESPLGRPTIDKLEFRLIPDQNTQIAELLSGGIDWMWRVTPDQAKQLIAMPTLAVTSGETMRIGYLQLDQTEKTATPALRDVRVRRALNMAIDREALAKVFLGEGSRIVDAACFPTQFGCTDEGVRHYPYDPKQAKALLAEAGFPNGFETDLYAYRDRPLAEAVIGYFRAIGVKASLQFQQYAANRDAARAHKAPVWYSTWGSFSINDASASVSTFFTFSADDLTLDPQVRDWLKTADTSVDPAVRKENYKKALDRISDQAYWVPLSSFPLVYAYSKDLAFTPYTDELPRFWEAKWK
jgi:peptide/nickel transport system substrate-binding protein